MTITMRALTFFNCDPPEDIDIGRRVRTVRSVRDASQHQSGRPEWTCYSVDGDDAMGPAAALDSDPNVFLNIRVTDDNGALDTNKLLGACTAVLSNRHSPQLNFRAGVAVQHPIETPFFPFASSDRKGFAFGLELVPAIEQAVRNNCRKGHDALISSCIDEVGSRIQELDGVGIGLEIEWDIPYLGIDTSLVPFPYSLEEQSVGALIELLGNRGRSRSSVPFIFGMPGTLAVHTDLTEILRGLSRYVKTTGFCGAMYSLLEDPVLSSRYSQGAFDFHALASLAATCGCGLDMIPAQSGLTEESLASLIMDTYALSRSAQKPLGVRILPTDRAPGEFTHFDHEYITNAKVRAISGGLSTCRIPEQREAATHSITPLHSAAKATKADALRSEFAVREVAGPVDPWRYGGPLSLKLDTIELRKIRRITGEQAGGRLLDLGCGTGLHAVELCMDFWVTAIDLGSSHLERNHECLTCIQGDVRHLTRLTDEQFDVVLLNGLVQYLTKAEIAQMAEDLRVAMHPGGLLLIKHPTPVDGVEFVSSSPRDGLSSYYSNHWADDTLTDLLAAFTLDHTEQAFTNDDLGKDFCKVESCPDTIQQWMVFRRGI